MIRTNALPVLNRTQEKPKRNQTTTRQHHKRTTETKVVKTFCQNKKLLLSMVSVVFMYQNSTNVLAKRSPK